MKTEELIRALAADDTEPPASLENLIMAALTAGMAVAAALFVWKIGLRPNLLIAAADPRVALKFLVGIALGISAAGLLFRIAHPGMHRGVWAFALLVAPGVLALGIAYELMAFPPSLWGARLVGRYSAFCLTSIPMLAAPILVALLLALHQGAPTRPALAGAVAGLVAGGLGAALYAMHCPDDSPLFVLAWYGLAIAAMVAVGALIGSRLLRW